MIWFTRNLKVGLGRKEEGRKRKNKKKEKRKTNKKKQKETKRINTLQSLFIIRGLEWGSVSIKKL